MAQIFGAIREIFQVFDLNGDKALDVQELKHAFQCMVTAPPPLLRGACVTR
jgi:hypothetical protein